MFPKANSPASTINWSSEVKQTLFDTSYTDSHKSAIDSFIEKNIELNLMIVDPGGSQSIVNEMINNGDVISLEGRKILARLARFNVNPKLMNLVLLGYVSSVEGYMRQLIRDLVNLDEEVQEKCELKSINFGTTYYQSKDMFPESLMDGISFISSNNIINTCKELLGVNIKASKGSRLEQAFHDFNSICQLRHCIVHRFGKVGATNAIKLGMHKDSFKDCIEKPISMKFVTIQKASKVTTNLIREINQFIWQEIMTRLMKNNSTHLTWTWDYRKDKRLFKEYFAVFFESKTDLLDNKAKEIYDEYRDVHMKSL